MGPCSMKSMSWAKQMSGIKPDLGWENGQGMVKRHPRPPREPQNCLDGTPEAEMLGRPGVESGNFPEAAALTS